MWINLVIAIFMVQYIQTIPISSTLYKDISKTLKKRALSYIANETVCVIDNVIYQNGDSIPTDDPCELCKCRPPGFACILKECDVKPGCKEIAVEGECCPTHQCGCEHDGKFYKDGEIVPNPNRLLKCYTCRCRGSSIICGIKECQYRFDCQSRYEPNECCPFYDNCDTTTTKFSDFLTSKNNGFTTESYTTIKATSRLMDLFSPEIALTTSSEILIKNSTSVEETSSESTSNLQNEIFTTVDSSMKPFLTTTSAINILKNKNIFETTAKPNEVLIVENKGPEVNSLEKFTTISVKVDNVENDSRETNSSLTTEKYFEKISKEELDDLITEKSYNLSTFISNKKDNENELTTIESSTTTNSSENVETIQNSTVIPNKTDTTILAPNVSSIINLTTQRPSIKNFEDLKLIFSIDEKKFLDKENIINNSKIKNHKEVQRINDKDLEPSYDKDIEDFSNEEKVNKNLTVSNEKLEVENNENLNDKIEKKIDDDNIKKLEEENIFITTEKLNENLSTEIYEKSIDENEKKIDDSKLNEESSFELNDDDKIKKSHEDNKNSVNESKTILEDESVSNEKINKKLNEENTETLKKSENLNDVDIEKSNENSNLIEKNINKLNNLNSNEKVITDKNKNENTASNEKLREETELVNTEVLESNKIVENFKDNKIIIVNQKSDDNHKSNKIENKEVKTTNNLNDKNVKKQIEKNLNKQNDKVFEKDIDVNVDDDPKFKLDEKNFDLNIKNKNEDKIEKIFKINPISIETSTSDYEILLNETNNFIKNIDLEDNIKKLIDKMNVDVKLKNSFNLLENVLTNCLNDNCDTNDKLINVIKKIISQSSTNLESSKLISNISTIDFNTTSNDVIELEDNYPTTNSFLREEIIFAEHKELESDELEIEDSYKSTLKF